MFDKAVAAMVEAKVQRLYTPAELQARPAETVKAIRRQWAREAADSLRVALPIFGMEVPDAHAHQS